MAARKQKQESQINLLPQKGFEASTGGRILLWALSTFRIIVIVTEILVMIAFLSRFWLDAQNTDLKEELQQKQAVIAASLNFEQEFRETQKKLEVFSDITAGGEKISNSLSKIKSYLPSDVFLVSISFSDSSIEIEGTSPSERSIQQFAVNIASDQSFEEIEIGEIKSETETPDLLTFKLRTVLKKI